MQMHDQSYMSAYFTYLECKKEKVFDKAAFNIAESFKVAEAYLYYLISIHKLKGDKKAFRINKFLNEVPTFSKDKRVTNVPILIIQILYLIQRKQYNKVFDRLDALTRYTSRYLRRNEAFRSNCFIRMLVKVGEQSFHRVAVERHTKELRKKLSKVPITISGQTHEVEIIPYEDLWEMVVDSLGWFENNITF